MRTNGAGVLREAVQFIKISSIVQNILRMHIVDNFTYHCRLFS